MDVEIPGSVLPENRDRYVENLLKATHNTGRLMLFAGDQKIEHLNRDFYGEGISEDDATPAHLFEIASKARIGVFATQLGLISRFGPSYPEVPYLVKLNSKTNLVKTGQKDPLSRLLVDVDDVMAFRESSGLDILGIGYTIYLGSEYEDIMLAEASQAVFKAHRQGLITVLWIYPRGKAVPDERDPHLIAGAAGVAACLGSDFVKVNPPKKDGVEDPALLKEATLAAGKTKVVCAGGSAQDPYAFFKRLYEQIHIGGTCGNATGRNIHQKPLEKAVRMCNAISAITFDDKNPDEAMRIYGDDG
ncbi:MAG: aldolase [Methanobacteriota archaeon]|nr:MAG: aldolase [Euryarchaeota archaeon]